jgi:hypothetical protein
MKTEINIAIICNAMGTFKYLPMILLRVTYLKFFNRDCRSAFRVISAIFFSTRGCSRLHGSCLSACLSEMKVEFYILKYVGVLFFVDKMLIFSSYLLIFNVLLQKGV